MRKLAPLFTLLCFTAIACTESSTDAVCEVTPPNTQAIACDVSWSCDDDTLYQLQCATEFGTFKCSCFTDGVEATSFNVASFECTMNNALSTATSGCGWAITVQE